MYGVFTMFGYVIAVLHCPQFTMSQCEAALDQMREPKELESANYCTTTPPPVDDLPPEVHAAIRRFNDTQQEAGE